MTSLIRYKSLFLYTTVIGSMLLGCNQIGIEGPTSSNQTVVINNSGSHESGAIALAIKAQTRGNATLLGQAGIVGTGASVDDEGNPVIVVFVSDSGSHTEIPESIDGVRVTVEVTGVLQPLGGKPETAGPRKEHPRVHDPKAGRSDVVTGCYDGARNVKVPRPVPIGVSAGTAGFSGGTYGARLRDSKGNLYMLSNNHVFAGRNSARLGAKAIQPRPQDGGSSLTDSVGTLFDFEPLVFFEATFEGQALDKTSVPVNIMDAAVVATSSAMSGNSTPCDGYGIPSSLAVPPRHGPVQKYGRTTGLTKGNITAINATVDIMFAVLPNGNLRLARFVNQIIIRKPGFCNSGDSGSLVVTNAGNPIGMVFAGSPASSSFCIANPILPVLSRFNMTVDGI